MYSKDEIRNIHSKGLSKLNKIYKDNFGNKYIGIKGGRLKLEISASNSSLPSSFSNSNVKDELVDINSKIDTIENELDISLTANYKILEYDNNENLVTIKIYNNSTDRKLWYLISLTYTNENLTNKRVESLKDEFIYNKSFSYNGNNNLIEITKL